MKLTIGMACHDDFHGVVFTIQSLALHHDLSDCEIVVVDNNPSSPHGQETKRFCDKVQGHPVRYYPLKDVVGTTQTRERIFRLARGEAVMVMDCHVLLVPGAVARLKQFYQDHPACQDLLSGPLIIDHLHDFHTHFNDQWRGGMWGTWGSAWKCACQRPLKFTTYEEGDRVAYRDLVTSKIAVESCPCGRTLPSLAWAGHQQKLFEQGYQPLFADTDEPFEIPGQGLGLFTCRKDAWLGFNPHFRGFGGEELYIHTKYRQAGHKAICLPWLKWWHRFGRPDGVKYPLDLYSKVRNYVLGHQELGLDLAPIHDHFVSLDTHGQDLRSHLLQEHSLGADQVDGKSNAELVKLHAGLKLTNDAWDFLLSDPVGHVRVAAVEATEVALETGRPQPPPGASLDEIFEWCRGVPRDLDRHLPIIRELAAKCDHATEITKRRESSVALLAARPKMLISYQKEADVLFKALTEAIKSDAKEREGTDQRRVLEHTTHWHVDSAHMNAIAETDLLFLDSVMSGERLKLELDTHAGQVRRFIIVRGTGAFGAQAEGSKEPGLFWALAPFLTQHPEWRIIHHSVEEYGITCLSKNPQDYPEHPIHAWAPGVGPGTELHKILSTVGIEPTPACDCRAKAAQMDMWGVHGCKQRREEIIGWMREGYVRWGWAARLRRPPTP